MGLHQRVDVYNGFVLLSFREFERHWRDLQWFTMVYNGLQRVLVIVKRGSFLLQITARSITKRSSIKKYGGTLPMEPNSHIPDFSS